ncbi:MAG: hypothetical protein OEY50_10505 [Nitrospinota bacterium]|nr:hypothetical protein [Nitrospinota bacterium]MDH5678293.1 hypothetical protein [Nitrospinota bacterium]MDH5755034.1 hypothetical protein [Nitrospinota bacterium]
MRLTLLAAITAALLALWPAPANAVSVSGRISGSYYNHDDDISEQDRSISRIKLRLDVDDFMPYDSSFHLRTITRSVSGHDYNSNLPGQRIEQAEFEMNGLGGFMDLHLGRMNIEDIFSTRVDGANVDFHLGKTFGFGLFGGQTPDPFSDQINSSYSTYGGYLFNRGLGSRFSLGYVATAKGGEDSTYISGMYYSLSSASFNWMVDFRMDEDKANSEWRVTESMLNMTYRPSKRTKVNLNYTEYRSIQLFESMDYDASYDMQRSTRLSGDIYILKSTLLYARFDGRMRDIDNGTATLVTAGVRQDDMFGFMRMDFSYNGISYFTTSSSRINFMVGADLIRDLSGEIEITSIDTTQEGQSNSMSQFVFGASLDWWWKNFFVSAMLQYSNEKYLDVDAIYTNKASDHFSTVVYYLNLGYKF